eukprot:jgi/Botrbrau1/2720/Bobra.0203s0062.1
MEDVVSKKGKVFRREFVKVIGAAPDPSIIVECTGLASKNRSLIRSHDAFMDLLFRTLFCPVLAGDSQSSQHVVERYIAGCIPVFPGPPFHGLPFEKEVCPTQNRVYKVMHYML